jgi:two-component system, NtrC family, sensor histidine kinase AtoS
MSAAETLLSMRGIEVSYGGTPALRGADFDLARGEIHALVGAHRAGKSSLVKLLSGAVRKDAGEIVFDGRRVGWFTPRTAIRSGIGIVYQHLNIIPSLSAAENIFAGRLAKAGLLGLDHHRMRASARELFSALSFEVNVDVPVSRLTAAAQHMVELARVLSLEPRVLILDEVSSKLTPEEMERIYPILRRFREDGKSVIYISHNMDEIFQFADRVTILKDGRTADTERIQDLDRIKLIKLAYSFVLSREELGRQNLELLNLKRYNENIIKNIPVGVIILNPSGGIHLVNFAALGILGLQGEIVGSPFAAAVRREDFPDLDQVMEHIEARQELLLTEAPYREEKILKVSVYPFRDEDYVFLGTILLMEDISRERSMEEYVLRTEKLASTAVLAAGVAHEINNPLGIVQNYVDLLKLREWDADSRGKLEKIENEVTRIEKTVGSLLSFSRFDDVTFHDVDLLACLDEVILLLAHRFAEKDIRVLRKEPSQPALIRGDENKLKQLFMNLLSNGIEAVEQGGRIEAALAVPAGAEPCVELTITDNGCGIPAEIADRIFDPFFSTKKGRRNAGLGLSICQSIVGLHGGIISCTSQPGICTSFLVRFGGTPARAARDG